MSACQVGDGGLIRKWQPTPVFLPGESHGQRSLLGYSPWGSQKIGHDLATKQKWQQQQHMKFQFSSVTQLCLTLCIPKNRSMPGLPVHHQLPEFAQLEGHKRAVHCRGLLHWRRCATGSIGMVGREFQVRGGQGVCGYLVCVGQSKEAGPSRPSCHPLLSPARPERAELLLVQNRMPR